MRTYCGVFLHSTCLDTFSALSPENLSVIKECAAHILISLRHLPTRVALLEKKLEFISRTEVRVKDVKHTKSLQHGSVLDKAVKDTYL